MFVNVNTHNSIAGSEDMSAFVEDMVNSKLNALSGHLTAVEVHLSVENAHKGGNDDIRCTVEARPKGRQPVAVAQHAANMRAAVTQAVDSMRNRLDSDI